MKDIIKRNNLWGALIIFFATALLLLGCECMMEGFDGLIVVDNNAPYSIRSYFAQNDAYGGVYPDTCLPYHDRTNDGGYLVVPIAPGASRYEYSYEKWSVVLSKLPQDTMSVFILHGDTLKMYSWDQVRDEYKILVRYDFSLEDLEVLKMEISYPPNDRMRRLKMWPSFDSIMRREAQRNR